MKRSEILYTLQQCRSEIARRFAVKSVSLFGSAARDQMRADSDVDVLVEFEGAATLDRYFGLKDFLEAAFGVPVDLVTRSGLKPRARRNVERDLIDVA
jgi:predicted nucleotidyltransferase